MKYIMCLTQQCNLRCTYCYIDKRHARMTPSVASKIVDFTYANTPPEERIDIGFFGGEPLLEFALMEEITGMIERHPQFDPDRVELALVTNGTIFSDAIADFLNEHHVLLGISCDGPPSVHDVHRLFPSGAPSSSIVAENVKRARDALTWVRVNAVYHPHTFHSLPQVVDYFSALGIREIHLNPDHSAAWSREDVARLGGVYDQVARRYIDHYLKGDPHFINLIDNKIAVILRGGYADIERCRMGRGEFAFSPEGNIFPCERLVGDGTENKHCIGNIDDGLDLERMSCNMVPGESVNTECLSCSLRPYCVNWCGCSNYMSTGYYNRVDHFTCVSEKAAIQTAFDVFETLEEALGPTFVEHLSGFTASNIAAVQ